MAPKLVSSRKSKPKNSNGQTVAKHGSPTTNQINVRIIDKTLARIKYDLINDGGFKKEDI